MNFVEAIQAARSGKEVSRDTFAPGVWLRVRPEMPGVILIRTIDGIDVPYVATVDDAIATDWGFGVAALRR